ncbi:MAG TPA: deoxyribose-phosphate aldolase [Bryobacteraceae bacterium]|nr:deoxyribose-phosphate aldolase [Bryobacteraceae bacterium]
MNSQRTIASLIDHTILKPDAVRDDIRTVCAEALQYGFASVCVNSFWTPFIASELRGSGVKACTVAGFPLGAAGTAAKAAETRASIADGAAEIDMVINIGAVRGGEPGIVEADIRAVAEVCHDHGAILKVIIETALLTDEEKVLACNLAVAAGADFVKTSTGFSRSGATTDDVALMRRTVGPSIGVKASGGIRTFKDLQAMVAAGANRIGASASVRILEAADDAGIGHAGY